MHRLLCAVVPLSLALVTQGAGAQEEKGRKKRVRAAIPEDELEARLQFLDERIAAQRQHAEIWSTAAVSFYSAGLVVQSARLFAAEETSQRAALTISVAKAAGGITKQLVTPFAGIQEFDRSPWSIAYESRLADLRRGEAVLHHNAVKTEKLHRWYAHVIGLGVNLTGAAIVAFAFDDEWQALQSLLLGVGFGELQLWLAPWEADDDLLEYEERFITGARPATGGLKKPPSISWRPVFTGTGVGLRLRF
ncbi:MAG: hypothetical protein AAGA56_05825 [Myxococcota bacterium]